MSLKQLASDISYLAKKVWLLKTLGYASFKLKIGKDVMEYIPNTVFNISESGYYRTVTFDTAHLMNLLRECAAKNRLSCLGLSLESLERLSQHSEYKYLKKILKLKNNCLEYDPMNQRSSALLFSEKTEKGLYTLKEFEAAKCVKMFRLGLLEALDTSGISSEDRISGIYTLKLFLEEKIDLLSVILKSGQSIPSKELLQMIFASLDSHVLTYANIDRCNPRRKGTGSVEQFFSQLTLMCDGGVKICCKEILQILRRVMITNSLRLTPVSIKGFKFLTNLKLHMTSYSGDDDDYEVFSDYPILSEYSGGAIIPKNSNFDLHGRKRKNTLRDTEFQAKSSRNQMFEGEVRRFVKKF